MNEESSKIKDKDETPHPPPRTSSRPSYKEIFRVDEAVKIFFLADSDVSSPFNRQSLVVCRGGKTLHFDDQLKI